MFGWIAYLIGYVLIAFGSPGMATAGVFVVLVGMLFHWRFWIKVVVAIVALVVGFLIGYNLTKH